MAMAIAIGRQPVQINTTPFVTTAIGLVATFCGIGWYAWGQFRNAMSALATREQEREKDVMARRAAVDLELERKNTALVALSRDIELRKSELLQIGTEERGRLRERVAVLEAAEKTFKDSYDSAMRENVALRKQVADLTAEVSDLRKRIADMEGKK